MIRDNIIIRNARIGLRNFSGVTSRYNPDGNRSFCIFFEEGEAQRLKEEGWNIKWTRENEDGERSGYLPVAVSFDRYPPKIVMISKKNKIIVNEEMVGNLDSIEFENVDASIRPYNWEVGEKRGIKAYLKTLYVTPRQDEFEEYYEDESELPF